MKRKYSGVIIFVMIILYYGSFVSLAFSNNEFGILHINHKGGSTGRIQTDNLQEQNTENITEIENLNANEKIYQDSGLYLVYQSSWFAIEYTPTKNYNLKKVELMAGGGSGNFVVQLRKDSSGYPSDTIEREAGFQLDSVDIGWQGAEFEEEFPLTKGRPYWIVFTPPEGSWCSIASMENTVSPTYVKHYWGSSDTIGNPGWEGPATYFYWMVKFFGDLDEIPTYIELVDFSAHSYDDGSVALAWETATEIDTTGFNLYRANRARGNYIKINEDFIESTGDAFSGAKYSFLDFPETNGQYFYKLQDVDFNGNSSFHGPISLQVRINQ